MFARICLPALFLLVLSIPAFAQDFPSELPASQPFCDLSNLDSKVSVLINQNDQLRQTLAAAIDENKVNQIIEASINDKMDRQAAIFDEKFTTLFAGMALFILGGIALTYWFFVSKLKKVISNG